MTLIVIRAIIEIVAELSGEDLKQLQSAVNAEMERRLEKPNGI